MSLLSIMVTQAGLEPSSQACRGYFGECLDGTSGTVMTPTQEVGVCFSFLNFLYLPQKAREQGETLGKHDPFNNVCLPYSCMKIKY